MKAYFFYLLIILYFSSNKQTSFSSFFLLKLRVNEIIDSPVVTHHFSQALSKKLRKGDKEEKVVPH